MKIKDLIPFSWRREKQREAVPVPVRQQAPVRTDEWFDEWQQSLIEQFFGGPFGGAWPESRVPVMNLRESDGKVCIEAEMPGIDPKDIDIQVENEQVIIRGRRRETSGEGSEPRVLRYGSFERVVRLPRGVDSKGAKANFRNGVLELSLPKLVAAECHRISVNAG
jgi:HSP20 family protein